MVLTPDGRTTMAESRRKRRRMREGGAAGLHSTITRLHMVLPPDGRTTMAESRRKKKRMRKSGAQAGWNAYRMDRGRLKQEQWGVGGVECSNSSVE
jgi:hypothetical protein